MIEHTATLGGDFWRVYPGDGALVRDDEAALQAALARYHETGDDAHLQPFLKQGKKVTRFKLRHLYGRADVEFDDVIIRPTLGVGSRRTTTTVAHLCLAGVEGWDLVDDEGKPRPLRFHVHEIYPFPVLTAESFDDLCAVNKGELVAFLGMEAYRARRLSPKP